MKRKTTEKLSSYIFLSFFSLFISKRFGSFVASDIYILSRRQGNEEKRLPNISAPFYCSLMVEQFPFLQKKQFDIKIKEIFTADELRLLLDSDF